MIEKLKKLLKNSHSPYSKVKVSSIVKTKNGKLYQGVNVENSSYGATICAERVALTQAISDGAKKSEISEVHVFSNLRKELYPCSICRQVMTELITKNCKIIIHGSKEKIVTNIEELVPHKVTSKSF